MLRNIPKENLLTDFNPAERLEGLVDGSVVVVPKLFPPQVDLEQSGVDPGQLLAEVVAFICLPFLAHLHLCLQELQLSQELVPLSDNNPVVHRSLGNCLGPGPAPLLPARQHFDPFLSETEHALILSQLRGPLVLTVLSGGIPLAIHLRVHHCHYLGMEGRHCRFWISRKGGLPRGGHHHAPLLCHPGVPLLLLHLLQHCLQRYFVMILDWGLIFSDSLAVGGRGSSLLLGLTGGRCGADLMSDPAQVGQVVVSGREKVAGDLSDEAGLPPEG